MRYLLGFSGGFITQAQLVNLWSLVIELNLQAPRFLRDPGMGLKVLPLILSSPGWFFCKPAPPLGVVPKVTSLTQQKTTLLLLSLRKFQGFSEFYARKGMKSKSVPFIVNHSIIPALSQCPSSPAVLPHLPNLQSALNPCSGSATHQQFIRNIQGCCREAEKSDGPESSVSETLTRADRGHVILKRNEARASPAMIYQPSGKH